MSQKRSLVAVIIIILVGILGLSFYKSKIVSQRRVPLEEIAKDYWYLAEVQPLLNLKSPDVLIDGSVLESMEKFSKLFDGKGSLTYSIISDDVSGDEFVRVDRVQRQIDNYQNMVTAFYGYDFTQKKYLRLLTSSKAQSGARYPTTSILSQDPLIVQFYYDVSRPLECYGYDCRSYWADFYRWDSNQKKFIGVNSEHKEFYRKLSEDYQRMNLSGCNLADKENPGAKTLEEVHKQDKNNYCGSKNFGSTKEELNKFIDAKKKISSILSER